MNCNNCALSCKKDKICSNYLPITPLCVNCVKSCKNYSNSACNKWKPNYDDPFITMVLELSKEDPTTKNADVIAVEDFERSENFFSHCMDRLNVTLFPRQLWEVSNFFGEICWDRQCTNPNYNRIWFDDKLGDILDNVSFLVHDKCPNCGKTKWQIHKKYNIPYYTTLVGVAGQRSGKTDMSGMIGSYIWEKYITLPGNIPQFFGLSGSTKLHFSFVALTFGQAKETLWDAFTSYLRKSWFTDYVKEVNRQCVAKGIEPRIKFEETYISYRGKNLYASPLGPDKRTLRGRTRAFDEVDEFGWFTGGKQAIKINPEEVFAALSNSLKTIRAMANRKRKRLRDASIPTAYDVLISSPRSSRDGIMTLLYSSKKIETIYSFHCSTWEFNPNYTREDFNADFDRDPVAAKRDFGALPPLASNPFIEDPTPIKEIAEKGTRPNILNYGTFIYKNKRGDQFILPKLKGIRNKGYPMIMGVDAGYSNNAFAIILASLKANGIMQIEGALEVKPLPNIRVNFPKLYDKVIYPIIDNLDIVGVFFDRWQSIDLSQRIEDDFDIYTERYSLTYKDFDTIIRPKILGGIVRYPQIEVNDWESIIAGVEMYEDYYTNRPISLLLLQTITVTDLGKQVTKADDLDDDLFRAFSLCCKFVEDEDIKLMLRHFGEQEERPTGSSLVVKGLSTNTNRTTVRVQKAKGLVVATLS